MKIFNIEEIPDETIDPVTLDGMYFDEELSNSVEKFIKRQNEIEQEMLNDTMPFWLHDQKYNSFLTLVWARVFFSLILKWKVDFVKIINEIFGLFINFFINIFNGIITIFEVPSKLKFLLIPVVAIVVVIIKTNINPEIRFIVFWGAMPFTLSIIGSSRKKEKSKAKKEAIKTNNNEFENESSFDNSFDNFGLVKNVSHIERRTTTTITNVSDVTETIYLKGGNN